MFHAQIITDGDRRAIGRKGPYGAEGKVICLLGRQRCVPSTERVAFAWWSIPVSVLGGLAAILLSIALALWLANPTGWRSRT